MKGHFKPMWDSHEVGKDIEYEAGLSQRNISRPDNIPYKTWQAYAGMLTYTPHSKQAMFHKAPNKVRAFYGGPRSGKSTANVMELLWWCTGTHPFLKTPEPPIFARSVAPDFNRSVFRILLPKYRTLAGELGGPILKDFSKERMILYFQNGSEIENMTYEQNLDKFLGQALHIVSFDEEPREDIYYECLNRTIDYDGRVILGFTPRQDRGYSWSYETIRYNRAKDPIQIKHWLDNQDVILDEDRIMGLSSGKVKAATDEEIKALELSDFLVTYFDCQTSENPFLSKGSFDRVRALSGDDQFGGTYVTESSMVFTSRAQETGQPYFIDEIHVHDRLPANIRYEELDLCLGVDHQEGRNPEAIVICGVDRYNRLWVLSEVYYVGLVREYAQSILKELGGRRPIFGVIDHNACTKSSVSGISAKDEYGRHGVFLVPAMKGPGSVDRGIAMMRQLFLEKRLMVLRQCVNTIKQIKHCLWGNWVGRSKDQKDPKERLMQHEIHAVDALRYVVLYGDGPKYRGSGSQGPSQPARKRGPLSPRTGY